MRFKLLIGALAAAAVLAGPVAAKTLRWASQGDILTFDPMSQNESLNNTFSDYVYDGLVRYNKQFVPEPALATSWTRVSPTVWRFNLRKNVKFHDGTPMTADDVVFSFQRVLAPSSNMKVYAQGIKETKKIDDFTVEVITDGPNPVLLRGLVDVKIMSKAWATKHNVVNPQDYVKKEETHAARNTNGTGQFMLKSFEPDVRTVLVANPNWWDKAEGNVTEIVYRPIKSDATRAAALLSSEVDLVLDPPTQDIPRLRQNTAIKIADGTETRIIFLGMDQWRDESPYTDVKGKNPFKDKRVRQAMYQAIDIEAIRRATMRGLSVPTGSMIAPQVNGYFEEFAKRLPHDEAAARKLLADAGYPDGLLVHARLPEQPLHQRRGDLHRDHGDVGEGRPQGQAQRDAAGDVLPEDPEERHQRLPAGLGDGDVRRALHAAEPDPDAGGGRQGRRRQLQPRQVQQSEGRRADRPGEDRDRRREAQPGDARCAADPRRRRRPHPAAPAGDPVGDALERLGVPPGGQPPRHALGEGRLTACRRPRACGDPASLRAAGHWAPAFARATASRLRAP